MRGSSSSSSFTVIFVPRTFAGICTSLGNKRNKKLSAHGGDSCSVGVVAINLNCHRYTFATTKSVNNFINTSPTLFPVLAIRVVVNLASTCTFFVRIR